MLCLLDSMFSRSICTELYWVLRIFVIGETEVSLVVVVGEVLSFVNKRILKQTLLFGRHDYHHESVLFDSVHSMCSGKLSCETLYTKRHIFVNIFLWISYLSLGSVIRQNWVWMQVLTFTNKSLNTLPKLWAHCLSNKEMILVSMLKNTLSTKFSRFCEMISTVSDIEGHFNKYK